MRFRFPVIGARAGMSGPWQKISVARKHREEIAAAQAGIDAYWEEVEPLGDATLYVQPDQMTRDEDEAYARNYAMDKQAEHINSRVSGPGPGYEEVPGWIRLGADKEDPEAAAADQKYLDWLDDEWHGYERGQPARSSRELDASHQRRIHVLPRAEETGPRTVCSAAGDDWEFEEWAQAHGYSEGDVAIDQRLGSSTANRG